MSLSNLYLYNNIVKISRNKSKKTKKINQFNILYNIIINTLFITLYIVIVSK